MQQKMRSHGKGSFRDIEAQHPNRRHNLHLQSRQTTRNNHFATLTRHDGGLYLLVTDLGYANTPDIVWEKLDDIDGDTEYCDERFQKSAPRSELGPAAGPIIAPELLLAQRGQAESDYQLALAMAGCAADARGMDDEEEGRLMDAAKELSLGDYNGEEDATLNVGDDSRIDASSSGDDARMDPDLALAMACQPEKERERSEHESEQLARRLPITKILNAER